MFTEIDTSLPLLGIPRECFTHPFKGVIPAKTVYKGQPILKLVEYRTKGRIYDYEDEHVDFWDPTEPTEKSHLFFQLKCKDQVESEYGSMRLSTLLDKPELTITSVCFEFFPANDSPVSYQGVILTPACLSEMQERIQQKNNESSSLYFFDSLFIAPEPYFLFVKTITKETVLEIMAYLSEQNPQYLSRVLLQSKR